MSSRSRSRSTSLPHPAVVQLHAKRTSLSPNPGRNDGRGGRDERRLTRSVSRSASPPRRRRSSFKEESRDGNNDNGRRRRSKQRYEPADRRGRKSSADVEDGREKRVDTEEKKDRGSPTRVVEVTKSAGSAEPAEVGSDS
ncbi:hypothetical protein DID88_003830 [Monilinia fructigena]|uniref:Uncharacterized protein n=1 Tax=Monilinia fructigena TaxID=38457 RepID=A0A395ITP1_9HELO|nr:hypothetical protein DID88_003830 [Monilinia fructigena]